jgi:hypothetical protein
MEPDQDNCDSLKHLLALARHEVPPPGFFDGFPNRVRAGIAAKAETTPRRWWERWMEWRPLRPALAGFCTLAACGWVVWKLGPGTAGQSADIWVVHPAQPPANALRFQPLLVNGTASDVLAAHGIPSTAPVTVGAPRGLFTPGAGLRASMTPASTVAVPRIGIQTGNQDRLAPRLLPSTNTPATVP